MQLDELLTDFTRDLMSVGLSLDDSDSKQKRLEVRATMMSTRVKLASLLTRRGDRLMELYDVAMQAAHRDDDDIRTRAGALFSVGAAQWLRGDEFSDEVREGMRDLQAMTHASVLRADAERSA